LIHSGWPPRQAQLKQRDGDTARLCSDAIRHGALPA
jgi:hypothetical protein